ncbi:MAG: sigma-70 family RNA polymerase sigma factor [Acidobacteria bacterium]|nr:sigma-70 family RNA polymerase sigma factor [Acidobacteriota bacterium]
MTQRQISQPTLVLSAQAGDVDAFEDLYRTHVGKVYGLCLRMLREPSRAEELTQEIFVLAWQKLGSFRGDSAFSTWLYRLAANAVLGHLRAQGRWDERFAALGQAAPERAGDIPRPDRGIDLERAIAALPPAARMVFLLSQVEGYRHREIAQLIGIAEGTSKAHLHHARQQLRKDLDR